MKKKKSQVVKVEGFLVPKNTKKYKNPRSYFNRIYELNKERIDKAYELSPNPRETFIESFIDELSVSYRNRNDKDRRYKLTRKQLENEFINQRRKVRGLIEKKGRSEFFQTKHTKFRRNLVTALKEDYPDAYEQIKTLAGRKMLRYNDFEYVGNNSYSMNVKEDGEVVARILVQFTNSPVQVIVQFLPVEGSLANVWSGTYHAKEF